MVTWFAPRRLAIVAQSIAVLPAPITTTLRPMTRFGRVQFALLDVFQSINNVLFARNAQRCRGTQAYAEKDGAKVCLEISQGEILAEFLASFHLHAQFCDHFHFREGHVHGFAKADDAVGGKAAGQVAFFEKRHTVAAFCEFAGTGKTRRARRR